MKRRIVIPPEKPRSSIDRPTAPTARGRLSLRYGGEKPAPADASGASE